MTDKQLAELEAKAEAAHREEMAKRMAEAMKAVNQVAPQMHHINYLSVGRK